MTEGLQDTLILILCLAGLILSWLDRWIEGEIEKQVERGKRNFGRSQTW